MGHEYVVPAQKTQSNIIHMTARYRTRWAGMRRYFGVVSTEGKTNMTYEGKAHERFQL